ncbi:bifunctional aconitate hydratase 2/2-methylisocitrate dehydratase [Desulfoluna spongiiphila]|uniref:Aconitate hydratase B n=1 Tax=Desulfoluna spongiiphila TaxID=419481 RepID=A0A1G5JKJ7_9BACT|nr:bifunctional aconitate hydratase 2/2-methylisocitrate dehydratase [Desulfoluna spongiiphila]SCY88922.1 aconitase [Desulfoluna spongiiphila]
MLTAYKQDAAQRQEMGIPPKPLTEAQVTTLCELLAAPPAGQEEELLALLTHRVPPGVDPAAQVKAGFLAGLAKGEEKSPLITPVEAVGLLGTMGGGYNTGALFELLSHPELGTPAQEALARLIIVPDVFDQVVEHAKSLPTAEAVLSAWADGLWFTEKKALPEALTVTVFKVDGECNTDDFSPAGEAWSRPDIPLHALSMLTSRDEHALTTIEELKAKGHPVAFVGDVVGTGSSRKSATNSLLWHIGDEIPFVPNKRAGGVVLGGKIAPIFFNTLEDAGALPIECDVAALATGQVVTVRPYEGTVTDESGAVLSRFALKTEVLFDEVRAGGRIPLIIGRNLTAMARKAKGLEASPLFRATPVAADTGKGFTLAQKIVGRACGLDGVRPGTYCEPKMTTVGSQDTTGPMTRDELTELACLSFASDLVMQSFCHTAAYPRPVDIAMHDSLPGFMTSRGGVALKPGDGVIHSFLNRMILPDTVGTGGDSHTRFPMGLSFPAGSGLVAFAAAMGRMPLDMPESILVRFTGTPKPGITLRDIVNAIPLAAIEKGLLTVAKEGKKNVFSGRILEMEGLDHLSVDEAFELTDASAERSAAAATIRLSEAQVTRYLRSNVALLKTMVKDGYAAKATLEARIEAMEAWLKAPELLTADGDAEYAEVIEIDLATLTEPILACPNDPDDVKRLSEVTGTPIDEVFIGSCMTHIGHFRAAAALLEGSGEVPVRLWMTPPTMMDQAQLRREGLYNPLCRAGARMEIPGCSLCMGNQARVAPNTTVLSTSTRNFPNRIGDGANVFLGSAELAAVTARLGKLPDAATYFKEMTALEGRENEIYRFIDLSQEKE